VGGLHGWSMVACIQDVLAGIFAYGLVAGAMTNQLYNTARPVELRDLYIRSLQHCGCDNTVSLNQQMPSIHEHGLGGPRAGANRYKATFRVQNFKYSVSLKRRI